MLIVRSVAITEHNVMVPVPSICTELGKLLDEEVATLNRHFELFSHQLDERIKLDGLPSDYYAPGINRSGGNGGYR